jgi:anaerobic ribonucleoside-triphosphate reductase activating protein
MEVSLSRVHFPVTTLGPGQRLGIWLQGCSIRCTGCISADTWGAGHRRIALDALFDDIAPWLVSAEGITISGGEPFDQSEALRELLVGLRARSAADIIVYSGYPLETLNTYLQQMRDLIDVLISDPYDETQPQTLVLRGSDNQRLTLLTELGRSRLRDYERKLRTSDKALDVMFDADGSVWMAGIPARGDLLQLRDLLHDQGHSLQTSVHRPRRSSMERQR